MSNLSMAREQLLDAWKLLQHQWQATCELWNDPVQRQFERETWEEFPRTVPPTAEALAELARIIAQARREVP